MSESGLGQKLAVEAFGTFLLTFIGAGSIIATVGIPGDTLIVVALAHGIALAIAVSAAMNISGGHINPAVTIALISVRKISLRLGLMYIVFQLIGAILAGYTLFTVFPRSIGNLAGWGVPALGNGETVLGGILFEGILTFILVFAVFGTAVDSRAPKVAGFAIGLAIAIDIMAGGPFTGAAMNPARAIGPAIASLDFTNWYVYWIGPILGGLAAGLFYTYIILRNQT